MFQKIDLTPVKQPDKMLSYWKREWNIILVVTISGLCFDGCMSFLPILQGRLLDTVIYQAPWEKTIRQGILFLSAVLLIQFMRAMKRYSVRVFANQVGAIMRREIYRNIMHQSYDTLAKEEAGDLMNKAVGDVDLCVEGMRKVTTEVFDTGVLMTGYLISMCFYDVKITLIGCIFIPLALWIASRLKVKIVKYNKEARAQSSKVAQLTYSNLERVMLYRIDGVMQKKQEDYEKELQELEKKSVRANVLENSMQPVYHAISMLGIGGILYLGGQNVIAGKWSVGTFTAYIAIFTALAVKASKASKLFNSFQKSVVSWKRLKPYYSKNVMEQADNQNKTDKTDSYAVLQVNHLSFSYPSAEHTVLEDISFQAKPGDVIGITGEVACGKTTLGLALTGLYPYQGSVKIDGEEISLLSASKRSSLISYEGHAAQLLSDTIYENITLGTNGDIKKVLHDVCFTEDLETMLDGVNTIVGNSGVRLSGGQQARIALARALWHQAPVVILDDPFASVDMTTEKNIMAHLKENYPDRIFVIMSHRLATFPTYEQVIFLKDKRALCGTHKEIYENVAEYKALFDLQSMTEANRQQAQTQEAGDIR